MIRWPRDALIFSVKAGMFACYAAGYVEGDLVDIELLGARRTDKGPALVSVREIHVFEKDPAKALIARLAAERAVEVAAHAAGAPIVRILDAFLTTDVLHPDRTQSVAPGRVIVVEELPGNVNAADLARRLAREDGDPPLGLAVRIVRQLVEVVLSCPEAADDRWGVTRRLENVLLSWDGGVFVQPHVQRPTDSAAVGAACVRHLLALATGTGTSPELTPALRGLVNLAQAGALVSLTELAEILDAYLDENPFDAGHLAGVLAHLFPHDRRDDLEFREELSACDIDALPLPMVAVTDYDPEELLRRVR